MIQILKEHTPIQKPDLILLDFDGTISKLRTGWYDVMRDLMVDYIPGDKEQVKKEMPSGISFFVLYEVFVLYDLIPRSFPGSLKQ